MTRQNPASAPTPVAVRLAYDIAQLRSVSPFGRSYIYEQIHLGRLRACKAGKRTIITHAAFMEFLELLERESPFASPSDAS